MTRVICIEGGAKDRGRYLAPDFPKAPYTTLATSGLLASSVMPWPKRP